MLLDHQGALLTERRIAEAIARARRTAGGGRPDEAFALLRAACGEATGVDHGVLALLDAGSAVALLDTSARVLSVARLEEAMGELADSPATARVHFERAVALVAAQRERRASAALDEALARLINHLD
ncbi:MAG: hypothetical protein ACOZQL_30635 [Myxococcota bacterium]